MRMALWLVVGRLRQQTRTIHLTPRSEQEQSMSGMKYQVVRVARRECLMQIQGVGSSANVIQADLRTCGASVVHIIDSVLLPFNPVTGPVPDG